MPGQTSAMAHQHTQAASSATAVVFTDRLKQNKKKKPQQQSFTTFCNLPVRQHNCSVNYMNSPKQSLHSGAFRAGPVLIANTRHGLRAVNKYLETFTSSVSFDDFKHMKYKYLFLHVLALEEARTYKSERLHRIISHQGTMFHISDMQVLPLLNPKFSLFWCFTDQQSEDTRIFVPAMAQV